VAITMAACTGVWVLMRWVLYDFFQLGDTRVYEHTVRMVDAGALPHRDFDVEYPPLATGFFWLIGRIPLDYQLAFSFAMLACLIVSALAALTGARILGLGPRRQTLAVAVVAITPLTLGTLVQTRYDLLIAALLGWTLVAAFSDRFAWAWSLLAVATAVKLVPVLLLPALALWHWHRRGRRPAVAGATAYGAGVAATILPFFALAPEETWRLFGYHLDRPLQIESLGSSIIHVLGEPFQSVNSYGSENVVGSLPDAFAAGSTVLLLASLVGILISFRGRLRFDPRTGRAALVSAFAATIAAGIALGKVISPQYLVWLLPAALLVEGRRGRLASIVVVVAMGLTQLVFPLLYTDLVERGADLPVWLLLARNVLLTALVAVVWPWAGRIRRSVPLTGSPARP
jgi:hypothetical protein